MPLKYLIHIGFEARGHRREGVDIVVRRQAASTTYAAQQPSLLIGWIIRLQSGQARPFQVRPLIQKHIEAIR